MPKKKLAHNPDLDVDDRQVKSILNKRTRYRKDFLTFCKERLQVIDRDHPSGAAIVPFEPNVAQLAFNDTIEKVKMFNRERTTLEQQVDPDVHISEYPVKIVVLKARKAGFSTFIAARAFWKCDLNEATKAMLMAHREDAAQNIAGIQRRFIHKFRDDNTSILGKIPKMGSTIEWCPEHDSKIILKTAGSKDGSNRSFTYQILHFSEIAHYADSDEVSAAQAAAATANETYFESTANGMGNIFHGAWEKAIHVETALDLLRNGQPMPEDWNGFFRFFWAWWQDPAYKAPLMPGEEEAIKESLDATETALVESYELTMAQIKWRRLKIRNECANQSKMSPEAYFCQEYPSCASEAFVTSGSNVFPQEPLSYMVTKAKGRKPPFYYRMVRQSERDYTFQNSRERAANFFVYEKPRAGLHYVMGVDIAQGLETGDYTVISIWSRIGDHKIHEVARYIGHCRADEAGELAVFLAYHYNNAFIMPERTGVGVAACERIFRLGYPNVYKAKNETRHKRDESTDILVVGFNTSHSTKPLLVEKGVQVLRDGNIFIRSMEALEQWRSYSNVDGQYTAPSGQHDDCVMADLLAIFAHFTPGIAPMVKWHQAKIEHKAASISYLDCQKENEKEWREVAHKSMQKWSQRNLEKELNSGFKSVNTTRHQRRTKKNPFE